MSFKVAAFNVENLFDRAKAFNEPNDVASKVLRDVASDHHVIYATFRD